MLRHIIEDLFRGIVKNLDVTGAGGIARALLAQHGDHHIVRRLVDKGDHGFLTVDKEVALGILCHSGFRNLPDEIPCEGFRQFIAQRFHIGFVHIAGFRGAHIGNGIMMVAESALCQKFRHDLLLSRCIEQHLTAAQTVLFVGKQVIQRDDGVCTGHIGGDMVRISDADIGSGVRGDVGDNVVIQPSIIGIQPQIDFDIGIELFKTGNGLLVDLHLRQVGIVFCPEGDLVIPAGVKAFRNRKGIQTSGTVTTGKHRGNQHQQKHTGN